MASSARKTNDLLDSVKGYLAGWRVEEDKYPADSGMPEFPIVELLRHVTMRSVQAGAVLAVPVAVVGATFSRRSFPAVLMRCLRNSTALGLVAGPVMTMGVLSKEGFDDDRIEDRALRIAFNESQQAWDRACIAATASAALPMFILSGTALGAVGAGFALGSLGLAIEQLGGPSVESLALAPWDLAYKTVVLPGKTLVWVPTGSTDSSAEVDVQEEANAHAKGSPPTPAEPLPPAEAVAKAAESVADAAASTATAAGDAVTSALGAEGASEGGDVDGEVDAGDESSERM